ncbi:FkbM family methyltransferase [Desulfovibrio sp. JC010]|uniref:FkbM family methyltransferase n=1 Tax=Desulfovibrio sp. JC010 TaxID=2593641 RepID=UPI0013D56098|nr:FkbM family methyltransferase [Desulfovibrio sp. JC010]NDV26680.1 FkbM family methyltransferase [Desulfovibrio sp. JC010]
MKHCQFTYRGHELEAFVPDQEIFRIDSVFGQEEYRLPVVAENIQNIWDVGANIGLTTLYFKILFPDAVVHSFEPCPGSLELLKKNTASLQGVTVHGYGLSDKNTTAKLHIHNSNSGQNSIHFSGDGYDDEVDIELKHSGEVAEQLGTQPIDILKIDTEGCEVEVLQALAPYLGQVRYVMLESHSPKQLKAICVILKGFDLIEDLAHKPGFGTYKFKHK